VLPQFGLDQGKIITADSKKTINIGVVSQMLTGIESSNDINP